MAENAGRARCPECRADVEVPASYSDGDQIKCRVCGTPLKVQRGIALRLVLADITGVKEALRANQDQVQRLEKELRQAHGSFGIGVNGLLIGIAYIVWQIGLNERTFGSGLIWTALAVALITGLLLEVANYFFLAKRREILRLSAEIGELQRVGRDLRQKLREAAKK